MQLWTLRFASTWGSWAVHHLSHDPHKLSCRPRWSIIIDATTVTQRCLFPNNNHKYETDKVNRRRSFHKSPFPWKCRCRRDGWSLLPKWDARFRGRTGRCGCSIHSPQPPLPSRHQISRQVSKSCTRSQGEGRVLSLLAFLHALVQLGLFWGLPAS